MEEILHLASHALEHAFWDTLRLVPFLFVTYLAMEAIEHKAGDKAEAAMQKAGKAGPLVGAVLGVVPQCGFSAAASTLYAGRVITVGTLLAVFLSTSDEMVPLFIAEQVPVGFMLGILLAKVAIACAAGLLVDFMLRRLHRDGDRKFHIHELCEQEHCACEEHHSVVGSALRHTLQVTVFIFLVSFALEIVIDAVGEDALAQFMSASPLLSVLAASLVGLIPNCAASVTITQLYLEGALGLGAMMAGLLVSAGVGLLVLFRTSRPLGRNCAIAAALWGCGVIVGIALTLLGF